MQYFRPIFLDSLSISFPRFEKESFQRNRDNTACFLETASATIKYILMFGSGEEEGDKPALHAIYYRGTRLLAKEPLVQYSDRVPF